MVVADSAYSSKRCTVVRRLDDTPSILVELDLDPKTGLPSALFAEPGLAFPRLRRFDSQFDSQSEVELFGALNRALRCDCELGTQIRKVIPGIDVIARRLCRLDFEIVVSSGRRINIECDGPTHVASTDWDRDNRLLEARVVDVVYRVSADDAFTRRDLCVAAIAHFDHELVNLATFQHLCHRFGPNDLKGVPITQRIFYDGGTFTRKWPQNESLWNVVQMARTFRPWNAV